MLHSRTYHIMLIEDNPGDVRLTQEAFRESKKNVHLTVIMDGQEALGHLRGLLAEQQGMLPDLILLDLNLPRIDGREILIELKSDPRLQHIPVVVLTTSIAEQDVMKCYRAHANCLVSKPVDYDLFSRAIENIEAFWLETAMLPGAK
jgi:chemotaxis family two-component system response regulator Rcp1